MASTTPPKGGSNLNRYRELISRLEKSRNRNFNWEYRPGLVPGSMRRGPNVPDIDFAYRFEDRRPGGNLDWAAAPERPVLRPGGNLNWAATPERPVLTPEMRDYIRNIGHTNPNRITTPESAMYDRLSKGGSLAGPTSPNWDSLKGNALVQARKEHQAKLAERSAKLHSVMKDF